MIELGNQEEINKVRSEKRKQILENFSNTNVVKAMTVTQFEERYPTEAWDRWSAEALKKFANDFEKSEDSENQDALAANLQGLRKVTVSDGELIADVFVREKPAQDNE